MKAWLGPDVVDPHEDDDVLTAIEAAAVQIVEGETGRYFGPVAATTEVIEGAGDARLRLQEIPQSIPATIDERPWPGADAVTITAANDDGYELRSLQAPTPNLAMLVRKGGYVWCRGHEYTVTYSRGYEAGQEPPDIRLAVLEISGAIWAMRDNEGGIFRSEMLGQYNYRLADVQRVPESVRGTVQRWRAWIV